MPKTELKKAFLAAVPSLVPIIASYAVIGITYGVLMESVGYSALWTLLMSAIAFCGSMQFAAVPLIAVAFNPFQAFLLSLFINARHLFYGIPLLKKYSGCGYMKPFLISALTDESFSINCAAKIPEGVNEKYYYFFTTICLYLYWSAITFIGGLLGKLITFNTEGLEFSMAALFIVFFLQQWEERKNRISGLIGVGCTVASLMLLGESNFMIPALFAILLILTAGRNRLCH